MVIIYCPVCGKALLFKSGEQRHLEFEHDGWMITVDFKVPEIKEGEKDGDFQQQE